MTPREQWIAYATIVLKEITRFIRIWQQTLVPPAISTVMYFVIFGSLIGERIGQMDGFDYMDFLVPGLILMAVINASYQNVVGSFFGAFSLVLVVVLFFGAVLFRGAVLGVVLAFVAGVVHGRWTATLSVAAVPAAAALRAAAAAAFAASSATLAAAAAFPAFTGGQGATAWVEREERLFHWIEFELVPG